jgi:iron(III) transport system ATP-binding protein
VSSALLIENLEKRFTSGARPAVDGVSFDVPPGEIVVLLGPSGCGKTTTLRCVAGLEHPTGGRISIGGRVVSEPTRGTLVSPRERDIGMVFQSYAVWPHMTVRQNVGYGLKMKRIPAAEQQTRLQELLRATKLEVQADRYPSELSGGQQQRVALARALAPKPDILLLDEPLSNLDANLRGDMRLEIRRLHDAFQYTSIYVTHDQVEAMTMADRIVVMNAGRIEQIGTPESVYEAPQSEFVARFIGGSNVLRGRQVAERTVEVGGHPLDVGQGTFAAVGGETSICVKTHDVELRPAEHAEQTSERNCLPGVVRSQAYLGSHREYIVDIGQDVLIAAPPRVDLAAGAPVILRFDPERCRALPR